ncbi:tetratricopeptide repeat protein [Limihaloglobus sulfuriphilus]|uniref:Tetratricopeptide repeat protein n=1 Tax=Limihaloglobus sulfuriphilus TaxID=1851148 RepID=A0A1Q2MEJ5_9BACT|nr:VWA domain-containing protein [Limihaloglobus sulfuriphilus]AQQ71074.1 tetratricopeptide repeat protein [Limihaloglobus sulfuriphilus]
MGFIEYKYLLLLVIAVVLVLYAGLRSKRPHERQSLLTALNVITVSLVIFALAGLYIKTEPDEKGRVYLLDISASIPDTSIETAFNTINEMQESTPLKGRLFLYASSVYEIDSEPERLELTDLLQEIERIRGLETESCRSATADALSRILDSCSSGESVCLFTDGIETEGSAARLLEDFSKKNVGLQVEIIDTFAGPEVLLKSVQMPGSIRFGEPASMDVYILSSHPQMGHLSCSGLDSDFSYTTDIELAAGQNAVSFPVHLLREGQHIFEVEITGEKDFSQENNRLETSMFVTGAAQICVLESNPASPVYNSLKEWFGKSAVILPLEEEEQLGEAQLLVIADTPDTELDFSLQERIAQEVRNGMGLLVTGGYRVAAGNAYSEDPMSELLPLEFVQPIEKRDPSSTVVYIIDTSGSMTGSRVELAKEVVRLSLKRLKPHDKAGIVEFYGSRKWAAPIQPASNAIDINRALNRLSAGGGTVILPAIEEAFYALQNVDTRTRHVLVLTDGGVEKGRFESLIRRMTQYRITLSTVLVGPGTHTSFLSDLAQWGRGKFYLARDRFSIPEVIFKQPKTSRLSIYVEKDFYMSGSDTVLFDNINFQLIPYLHGLIKSAPRPNATLSLSSDSGEPLYCRWDYGLGKVGVYTSQLAGQWSSDAADSDEYARLVQQICQNLYSSPGNTDYLVQPQLNGNVAVIDIHSGPRSSDYKSKAVIEGRLSNADGKEIFLSASSLLDDKWRSEPLVLESGSYSIDIGDNTGAASITAAPAAELGDIVSDYTLQNAAGSLDYSRSVLSNYKVKPLWTWCLLAALVSFMANIIIRRIGPRSATAFVLLGLLAVSSSGYAQSAEVNTKLSQIGSSYISGAAEKAGRELLSISDDETFSYANLPLFAMLNGDYASAARIYESQTAEHADFESLVFRGICRLHNDEYLQALENFEDAAKRAGLKRDRKYALALCIHASEKAGKLSDTASRWSSMPNMTDEHFAALIDIYTITGEFDDAVKLIEHARSNNIAEELVTTLEFQKKLIGIALEQGDTDKAKEIYRGLIKDERNRIIYIDGLARLMMYDSDRPQVISLYTESIEEASKASDLMLIAESCGSMGFYDLAEQAAEKALEIDPEYRLSATMFLSEMYYRSGETAHAIELIDRAYQDLSDSAESVVELAEAAERFGDPVKSISMLQRAYELSGGPEVLMRTAWLLEKTGSEDRAYETWYRMWQTATRESMKIQARDHLIDLASRKGRLADLVIELEESLDKKPDPNALGLLVDIYVAANDPISAVEVLKEYSAGSGDQVERINDLIQVYIRTEKFGKCTRLLEQLVEVDPENAEEYLQQIAVIAIERQNRYDAVEAIKRMEELGEAGGVSDEFSAGILSMLDMHEQAQDAYDRIIANNPDNIEAYLLWARAANNAGNREQAVERLRRLLVDEVQDDLFAIAVDGLLNLETGRDDLNIALARVYSRIAASPSKVLNYRLAVDICETLGYRDKIEQLLLFCSAAAGQRRAAIVRELVDTAGANANVEGQIEYGKLLLLLGEVMPPQVYIDLGRAALKKNDVVLAERIFSLADAGDSDSAIKQQVAQSFEDASMPEKADRIIRELLITDPDNVSLYVKSGSYCEQFGLFDKALSQYMRANSLIQNRMPVSVSGSNGGAAQDKKNVRRAANVNEQELFADTITTALISVSRTDQQKRNLLDSVTSRLESEILEVEKLIKNGGDKQITAYPRLYNIWKQFDRVALSQAKTELADEYAVRLSEIFKDDEFFEDKIITSRVETGLIQSCHFFLEKFKGSDSISLIDKTLLSTWFDSAAQELDPDELIAAESEPVQIANLALRLILNGREEKAMQVLRSMDNFPFKDNKHRAACIAMLMYFNDEELTDKFFNSWVDQKSKSEGFSADDFVPLINSAWPLLSEDGRNRLIGKITLIKGDAAGWDEFTAKLAGTEFDEEITFEQALELAGSSDTGFEVLLKSLENKSAEQRIRIFNTAISAKREHTRVAFILQLAASLKYDLSEDFTNAIVDTYRQYASESDCKSYISVRRYSWNKNPDQPQLGVKLAGVLLAKTTDNPAAMTAAVVAAGTAEDNAQAANLASLTIDLLANTKKIDHNFSAMVEDIAYALSPDDLDSIIMDVTDMMDIFGVTPAGLYIAAELNFRAGRSEQARQMNKKAFELDPSNRVITRNLIDLYSVAGRKRRLAEILSGSLVSSGLSSSYEWRTLVNLYCETGQPEKALIPAREDQTVLSHLNYMRIYHQMGDEKKLTMAFRKFVTDSRVDQTFFSPRWLVDNTTGGMKGYDQSRSRIRPGLYDVFANEDFALEEYRQVLLSAEPLRRDISNAAGGYAMALINKSASSQWLRSLPQNADEMNRKNVLVLEQLVRTAPEEVAAVYPGAFDVLAARIEEPEHEMLAALAELAGLIGRNDDQKRVYRLSALLAAADLETSYTAEKNFETIQNWLDSLPENSRNDYAARVCDYIKPSPFFSDSEKDIFARLDFIKSNSSKEFWLSSVDELFESPAASRLPSVKARAACILVRFEDFKVYAQEAMEMNTYRNYSVYPFDCSQMLCSPQENPEFISYLEYISGLIDEHRQKGIRNDRVCVQDYCLLARKAFTTGFKEKFEELVNAALECVNELSLESLWLLDCYELAGDKEKYQNLYSRLSEEGILPLERMNNN